MKFCKLNYCLLKCGKTCILELAKWIYFFENFVFVDYNIIKFLLFCIK